VIPRPRYCHCLCSHNHPERLGICPLPGYPSLLVEEVEQWPDDSTLCSRCHLHNLLTALVGAELADQRAA
jgi:hypothetical protein